jgi:hypothetical protein
MLLKLAAGLQNFVRRSNGLKKNFSSDQFGIDIRCKVLFRTSFGLIG